MDSKNDFTQKQKATKIRALYKDQFLTPELPRRGHFFAAQSAKKRSYFLAQNSALMSNVFNELRGGFLHERAIHMPLLL